MRSARSLIAAAWSALCIMPKESSTTSAGPSRTGRSPRAPIRSIQLPPCGLPNS
ncbi:Uncharacterised protein [Mycobacteroides abscessus subsp. abscessus]|nr:Uncharacterised protein [Mycobacteroides abscessus subsp. abscessus]